MRSAVDASQETSVARSTVELRQEAYRLIEPLLTPFIYLVPTSNANLVTEATSQRVSIALKAEDVTPIAEFAGKGNVSEVVIGDGPYMFCWAITRFSSCARIIGQNIRKYAGNILIVRLHFTPFSTVVLLSSLWA